MQADYSNDNHRGDDTYNQPAPSHELREKKYYLAREGVPRSYYIELWIHERYEETKAALANGSVKDGAPDATSEEGEDLPDYLTPNTLQHYAKQLHRYAAFVFNRKIAPRMELEQGDDEYLSEANRLLNREIAENGRANTEEFFKHLDSDAETSVRYKSVIKHLYCSPQIQALTEFSMPEREYYSRQDDLPDIVPINIWTEKVRGSRTPGSAKNGIRHLFQYLYYLSTQKLIYDEKMNTITKVENDWPEDLEERLLHEPGKMLTDFFKEIESNYKSSTATAIKSNIRKLYKWLKDEKYTTFDFHKWEQPPLGSRLPQHHIFQVYASEIEAQKALNTAKDYVRTLARFLRSEASRSGIETKSEDFGSYILNLKSEAINAAIERERKSSSDRMAEKLRSVLKSFYGSLGREL